MNVSADNNPLIVIVGPTAAGKSALALALAERLNGEVVNYDSVQLYRGFDVGSGKLPLPERRGVAHHLLDRLDPADVFTAGDYRREALKVLADLRDRGKLPIFAGGTGLYLRALLLGLFEGPVRSEALRERL
jgi:tRNA dimethylallyltransferase